ncbi:MAG: 50S ribosomal protein L17 [Planctomycetes bacterium]|jgi:large subunit ribosomal protein L17|nr:50S ribosomal protein L17 [Planctomycetota bacterium]MCA3008507.1 50S ribosomal protein L17 [Phycisphaerales bacterium]
MMHNVAGKRLGRNTAHRAALRKNFTVSLIKHERVVTTLPKAKALRPFVEKMITLARSTDAKTKLHRMRRAIAFLQDKAAVKKLFDVIGPRFANRAGGYTRILRLPDYRIGDGGSKVVFELVENNVLEQKIKAKEAAMTKDAEPAAKA